MPDRTLQLFLLVVFVLAEHFSGLLDCRSNSTIGENLTRNLTEEHTSNLSANAKLNNSFAKYQRRSNILFICSLDIAISSE